MKKFMLLTVSLMIGTSCFAMDIQENDPLSRIPVLPKILKMPATAPAAIDLPREVLLNFHMTGQVLLPIDVSFYFMDIATENRKDLRHFAILRGVSKNWYRMISAYFAKLSQRCMETGLKVEEEIGEITTQLEANNSVKRENIPGVSSDSFPDSLSSYNFTYFNPSIWNSWDKEAQDLFNKKLTLESKLIKNEYSIMEVLHQESLYRLVASNPFDRTEVKNRGKVVLNYIKSLRSQASSMCISLNCQEEAEKMLYLPINKSLARDVRKLEESKDIFGENAKKPAKKFTFAPSTASSLPFRLAPSELFAVKQKLSLSSDK